MSSKRHQAFLITFRKLSI